MQIVMHQYEQILLELSSSPQSYEVRRLSSQIHKQSPIATDLSTQTPYGTTLHILEEFSYICALSNAFPCTSMRGRSTRIQARQILPKYDPRSSKYIHLPEQEKLLTLVSVVTGHYVLTNTPEVLDATRKTSKESVGNRKKWQARKV